MLRVFSGVVGFVALCLAVYSLFIHQIFWLFVGAVIVLIVCAAIFFFKNIDPNTTLED